MPLNDYQMKYNGLTFGLGTNIGIVEVSGLDDLDVELADTPLPRGDGDIVGFSRTAGRSVVLELHATGAARSSTLADTLAEALSAFAPTQEPLPLYFKEPGFDESFVYARPIGRIVPRKPTLTFAYRPFSIRLKVADPRIYGAVLKTQAVPTTGTVTVTNDGNANAYPVVYFHGPTSGAITAVKLTNNTTGQSLDVATAMASSAETLTADMRSIVTVSPSDTPYINLNGVSKYGDWALPRAPFYLAPGDNALAFSVTGAGTGATCNIDYRDTRL